jgi:SPP1 gp7 family putative phage head morphogenesis protein
VGINKIMFKDTLKKKKRLPARVGVVPSPIANEVAYTRDLKNLITEMLDVYKAVLFPRLGPIQANISKDIPIVQDAGEGELSSVLGRVRLVIGQKVNREEIRRIAKKNLERTEDINFKGTARQVKRVSGVDIVATNPQVESTMLLSTANNVNLISGVIQGAQDRVEQIVYDGFRKGLRWESMVDDIMSTLDPEDGPVSSRAARIARDQTSKLNGELTKARQTDLGITHYIWRTSGDERVRDSHAAHEGERYAWDEPPATGHPGEDINCRCTAEPDISTALN